MGGGADAVAAAAAGAWGLVFNNCLLEICDAGGKVGMAAGEQGATLVGTPGTASPAALRRQWATVIFAMVLIVIMCKRKRRERDGERRATEAEAGAEAEVPAVTQTVAAAAAVEEAAAAAAAAAADETAVAAAAAAVFLSERRICGGAARELRDVQLTARFVRWGPDPVRQEKVRRRRTTTNLSAVKPVCSMLSRLVTWCIGGSPARRQCNVDIESKTWKQFIVF